MIRSPLFAFDGLTIGAKHHKKHDPGQSLTFFVGFMKNIVSEFF